MWDNLNTDVCVECSWLVEQMADSTGEPALVALVAQHLLDGHRHFDSKCIWCVRASLRKTKATRGSSGNADKEGLCVISTPL